MNILLVGNPNCGKTTLFNILTGGKQYVGNWPGVTVEKKEGNLQIKNQSFKIYDLPGIYSLEPNTLEQKITKNFLGETKNSIIVNVIDATNLERSLYLTFQLLKEKIPMIIALNMSDELVKKGMVIDLDRLSNVLGVPVISISAFKNSGISDLKSLIIKNKATISSYSVKCANCKGCIYSEKIYDEIDSLINLCVKKTKNSKIDYSEKIDKVLLNKYLSIPFFLLIMYSVFWVTFGDFTSSISDYIGLFLENQFKTYLTFLLNFLNAPSYIHSLFIDGIIPGVLMIFVFLPQITVLFILMSFLEYSGYMTRVAFIMDKLFSYFGLGGSSFIPMLMGFGCSVPAIMSCRILPSEKDRKLTIMLMPFISCNARLPVYALFAGVLFERQKGAVVFSIYLLGIFVALIVALILSKTMFKKDSNGFIMEIPPYRLPTLKNIIIQAWEKVRGFLIKAGTLLLIASVIVWIVKTYTITFAIADSPENSIIAMFGKIISPIFIPLGFGDWRSATALLIGIPAKEMIVSSLSMLSDTTGNQDLFYQYVKNSFSLKSAYSFMAFSLLYMPCLSTIITMFKELNSKRLAVFSLALSFFTAYAVSFIIYNFL